MLTVGRRRGRRALCSGDALALVREWLLLEVLGHVGLIVLRQWCGTLWTWRAGGPFAHWDVSRAMLHGDALWVIAVVCASAIRLRLCAEWGHRLAARRAFGPGAWLPWFVPGCVLGWVVLIRGDAGAKYILALPAGDVFETYHVLFFGYVFARMAAAAVQLAAAARLIVHRCRLAVRQDGPWPRLPLGAGVVAALAIICGLAYLHIFRQGGSVRAEWAWLARG
jgi:hypothetical protein